MTVLGVPVVAARADTTLDAIIGFVTGPPDGVCRHVATVNPEYVMAARRDASFAAELARTDVNTADGIGVLLAIRAAVGRRSPAAQRLTGVRLIESIAGLSGSIPCPIFLLGAAPGVADAAAAELVRRFPSALIAGSGGGGTPDPADDRSTLDRIAATGATVLFVAYGASQQVAWIERNREELARSGIRLAVGVGGALDMISGRVPRAPVVVQRIGLEWLYRLVTQPWRWRRQLVLPRFLVLAAWERARGQSRR